MLIEILLAASCSIEAAALGVCECSQEQTEGSFEVCATERITDREEVSRESPATPQPKPLRLCSWYANGTIDSPTLSVITAWVPIGSRLCIGDEVPEATKQVVSIDDEVSDVFGAKSRRPVASWIPGGEVEVGVPASYQFDGGSWQQSDAEIWLSSNELAISVVEIPRRTLLVTR